VAEPSQLYVGKLFQPARSSKRTVPAGLPLPPVDLSLPVWLSEIGAHMPWPPARLESRTDRMDQLWRFGRSDLSEWTYVPMPVGLYEALVDDYQTVLGDSPVDQHGGAEPISFDRAAKSAARSLLTYGAAVIIDRAGVATAPDMRYAWPLADRADGVVTAELLIDRRQTSPSPTSIVLHVITGGVDIPLRYAWTAADGVSLRSGILGERLPAPPMTMARAVLLRHGSTAGGAGEPLAEQLLPLAVRIERRWASIDYSLDRAERPLFTVEVVPAKAAQIAQQLGAAAGGGDLDPATVQAVANAAADHDSLSLVDGMSNPKYVTWDSSLEVSRWFGQLLLAEWSRKTGQAATEGGDSGDVGSGVAYARRQARLLAHIEDMHGILLRGAQQLWPALTWPWRDPLGEAAVPPSGPQPDAQPPSQMAGAV